MIMLSQEMMKVVFSMVIEEKNNSRNNKIHRNIPPNREQTEFQAISGFYFCASRF